MSNDHKAETLAEFTIQQLREVPGATGELSLLLRDIGLAAKRVNAEVNKAGLADILGDVGAKNIQGENVKKLDVFANNHFISVIRQGISCAGVASEENDDILVFDNEKNNNSKYVMLMDPLDGSDNIDVNVSIGTIFSIYKRISEIGTPTVIEDFLQPGIRQVAAGYILYGSSTMLVYATRLGVNGFTLDPSIGEFTLSHADIRCPQKGLIYSVNDSNYWKYEKEVCSYIYRCQNKTEAEGGPYTQRYIGSLVADIHRNLLRGGIFLYPSTVERPQGKLRLLYECNPLAYIIEQAGGKATDGRQGILDKQPVTLHQRSVFYIGSKCMMEELDSCVER